jgi:hypothetical protein
MNNYLDMLTFDNIEYIIDILSDEIENKIKLFEGKISEYNDLEITKNCENLNIIKYKKYSCVISKNIFNIITSGKTEFYIYTHFYDLNNNYEIMFKKTDILINPTYYEIIKASIELMIKADNYFIPKYTNITTLIDSIILSKIYITDDDVKCYYLDISTVWNALHNKLL